MKRRTKVLVASVVGVALAAGLTGVALASGPAWEGNTPAGNGSQTTLRVQDASADGTYPCEAGFSGPMFGGSGGIGMYAQWDSLSDLLGLTPQEIQEQRFEGKTLLEIAEAQGVSEQQLIDAIIAERTELLQERVDAGYITQEQADAIIEEMEEHVPLMLDNVPAGPRVGTDLGQGAGGVGPGYGATMGRGMMGGRGYR